MSIDDEIEELKEKIIILEERKKIERNKERNDAFAGLDSTLKEIDSKFSHLWKTNKTQTSEDIIKGKIISDAIVTISTAKATICKNWN